MGRYSWLDKYKGIYSSMLGGKIFCGISSNTESIHRTTNMQEGMLLTWVITGAGVLKTPDNEYQIQEDTIIFRHPRIDYQLTLYPGKAHRRCYFCLPVEFFELFLIAYPTLQNIPPVFPVDYNEKRLEEFLFIYEKIYQSDDKDLFEMMPYFERYLLHYLMPFLSDSRTSALEKAKQVLETNFMSSIPEIAESQNISYNTFRKDFVNTYGISPAKYRIRSRADQAKQLLSMGYRCSEVADKLGFPDLYTFSHQFKLVTGIPPKEYQKEHIF